MPIGARSAQYTTVTEASQKFTNPMQPGQQYVFSCTVNCQVKVTVTGGSAVLAAADNHVYVAGQLLPLRSPDNSGTTNAFVHVIRIGGTSGVASLALIEGA